MRNSYTVLSDEKSKIGSFCFVFSYYHFFVKNPINAASILTSTQYIKLEVLSKKSEFRLKSKANILLLSFEQYKYFASSIFWRRRRDSPASLLRSAARTRAPKQSPGLFLCFALPFSNLALYKKTGAQKCTCFLYGGDGEIRTRGGLLPN